MIDGKKSKFEFSAFFGGYDEFAVNSGKYDMLEAVEIYRHEMGIEADQAVNVGNAYVRHHAGVNEDGEPVVGWWLEYEEHKTSCPVYVMHPAWMKSDSRYTLVLPERREVVK